MGRPARKIDHDGTPATEFAIWLREAKQRAGLTFEQLASRTGYSVTAVQDACSGRRLPSVNLTRRIAAACGESPDGWVDYLLSLKRLSSKGDQDLGARDLRPPWARREIDQDAEVPPNFDPGSAPTRAAQPAAVAAAPLEPALRASPTAGAPARSVRRRSVYAFGLVIVAATASGVVWGTREQPHPGQLVGVLEQQFNRNGAPTFTDPHSFAGAGSRVPFKAEVHVLCKLLAPSIPSVSPDGYWYKIADSPWNGRAYAAANTFLNSDPPAGPYTHNTDFSVPDC